MAHHHGGYDNEFVGKVPDRYICNICTNTLREPRLVVCCGQHYCHSCLEQWFAEKEINTQTCPHCRQKEEFSHVVDKKIKREILGMKVKCRNHQEGCTWINELGSLNDHLESSNGCGYVEVECPNRCTKVETWKPQTHKTITMKRKDVENHLERNCNNREYQCKHCGKKDTYIEITGEGMNFVRQDYHYKECPEIPTECPNKCGADKIKRKNVDNHRTKCPLETVYCPNKCRVGVKLLNGTEKDTDTRMLRKNLDRHLKDQCYLRPYKCEYCKFESTFEKITGNGVRKQPTNHYDDCKECPLPCPNECGETEVKRRSMKVHRSICPEETVLCPNKCDLSPVGMKRKYLNKHVTSECPLRQYTCKHCSLQDTYTAITNHEGSCPKHPSECPNQCGAEGITRDSVKLHCTICPIQPIECPFAEAGCKTELLRQDLLKHSLDMQQKHLLMIMGSFKQMKQEHQEELQKTRDELQGTKSELTQTKEELEQTRDKLRNIEKSLSSIQESRSNRGRGRGRARHYQQSYGRARGRYNHGYESDTSGWRCKWRDSDNEF